MMHTVQSRFMHWQTGSWLFCAFRHISSKLTGLPPSKVSFLPQVQVQARGAGEGLAPGWGLRLGLAEGLVEGLGLGVARAGLGLGEAVWATWVEVMAAAMSASRLRNASTVGSKAACGSGGGDGA
jgi:hypothetical protein